MLLPAKSCAPMEVGSIFNPTQESHQSYGTFDLQVNGYGGVDFNADDLSAETLHLACERLAADGLGGILAPIVTEEIEVMARRLRNLAELRERDELARRLIAGFLIEGPFLSARFGFRGAHPRDAILPAHLESTKVL